MVPVSCSPTPWPIRYDMIRAYRSGKPPLLSVCPLSCLQRTSRTDNVLQEGFSAYPGFDVILSSHRNSIMTDTVRTKLTQNLSAFTQALADEAAEVLDQRWGQSKEWHSIDLGDDVLYLIAHLSARVFLG